MACANDREFIVFWYIENYSFCYNENGTEIVSPLFRTECLRGSEWKLHLVPREINNSTELTQCFLRRYDKNDEISIDYKIELLDPNGTVLKAVEGENENFKSSFDSDCTLEIESAKLFVPQWTKNMLTIRCQMKNVGLHPKTAIGCEVRTKILINSQIFFWEVSLPFIDTARKEFSLLEETKLKVELAKPVMSLNDLISIKISKSKSDHELQRVVNCKIFLIDEYGTVVSDRSDSHFFKSKEVDNIWKFPPFFSYLYFEKCSHEGKATLQFEFSVANGVLSETPPNFNYSSDADGLMILQDDLRKFFLSQKHTDFKIQIDENTSIPVHKSILIARSQYFENMFEIDMIEKQTGIIKVAEGKKTITAFLEYLYTGTIENMDCDCAQELIIASDKYLVPSLRDKCATYLMNAFNIYNVCKILDFAEKVRHHELKATALNYIAAHLKEIMPLTVWSEFIANKAGVVEEILSTVVLKYNLSPKINN